MRVLVTGHKGFIGLHVFRKLLDDGHEVAGYDWPDDLKELGEVREFDAVVNLAAIGGAGRAARNPAEVMKNNVGATIALRGALKQLKDWPLCEWPRVVHISSFSVYGDAPVPTNESAPLRPKEIYGASKLAQELCWVGYPGPVTILRLSSVYGSGMDLDNSEATVIAKIAKAARDNEVFRIFEDGKQERDFVHVGDVVDCVSLALVDDLVNGGVHIMNVCSGQKVSILQVCELLGAKYEITGQERAGDMRTCWGDATWCKDFLHHEMHSLYDHYKEILG